METPVPAPTVLYPLTLPALLDYSLSTLSPAPTTLIICSSRDIFLQHLSRSLAGPDSQDAETLQRLMVPTLRNLATAQHVNVAFCPSVQALLAHLSAYSGPAPKSGLGKKTEKATLVLVNPLSLHEPTPSFSAQGLSRTFAAAVETALRVGARLLLVECPRVQRVRDYHSGAEAPDIAMEDGEGDGADDLDDMEPWEQEVPILNSSVTRFASNSGERSWAGRTVKVSRIAARWFRFCRVRGDVAEEGRTLQET